MVNSMQRYVVKSALQEHDAAKAITGGTQEPQEGREGGAAAHQPSERRLGGLRGAVLRRPRSFVVAVQLMAAPPQPPEPPPKRAHVIFEAARTPITGSHATSVPQLVAKLAITSAARWISWVDRSGNVANVQLDVAPDQQCREGPGAVPEVGRARPPLPRRVESCLRIDEHQGATPMPARAACHGPDAKA